MTGQGGTDLLGLANLGTTTFLLGCLVMLALYALKSVVPKLIEQREKDRQLRCQQQNKLIDAAMDIGKRLADASELQAQAISKLSERQSQHGEVLEATRIAICSVDQRVSGLNGRFDIVESSLGKLAVLISESKEMT